eukprot:4354850-Pyramimonas_sp.AAC.1
MATSGSQEALAGCSSSTWGISTGASFAPSSTQMASVPEVVGLASGWDDANRDPFDDLDHMLDVEAADSTDAVPACTEGAEGQQPAAPDAPGRPADPLRPSASDRSPWVNGGERLRNAPAAAEDSKLFEDAAPVPQLPVLHKLSGRPDLVAPLAADGGSVPFLYGNISEWGPQARKFLATISSFAMVCFVEMH